MNIMIIGIVTIVAILAVVLVFVLGPLGNSDRNGIVGEWRLVEEMTGFMHPDWTYITEYFEGGTGVEWWIDSLETRHEAGRFT